MGQILIEKPSEEKLEELGVSSWSIWEKEASEFDWSYDTRETCYILQGKVKVETEDGESVEFTSGDLVVFPAGLNCKWTIFEDVRKHYNMG